MTGEDLIPVLTHWQQTILLPEVKGLIQEAVEASERRMLGAIDGLAQRFDRLETEYHMIVVGLRRVEERLDKVEQKLDRVEVRLDKVISDSTRSRRGWKRSRPSSTQWPKRSARPSCAARSTN